MAALGYDGGGVVVVVAALKSKTVCFLLERPASVLIAHAKAQRIATMLGLYLHCNSNILMHWSLPM